MRPVPPLLARNPIFAQAPAAALTRLEQASTIRTCKPRERIIVEGQPARHIYALLDGAVRMFHQSEKGDAAAVMLLRAPAVFGEAEALAGVPYQEHAAAIVDSEVLEMPVGEVVRLLQSEPSCAVDMLVDVASRLAIAAYGGRSLAFNPLTVRLANYLLDYAGWTTPPGSSDLRVDLTQEEMAAAIGGTRRSVAKDMVAWQREGVIERRGRCYVIRDVEALRRYSDAGRLELAYTPRASAVVGPASQAAERLA